MLRTIVHQHRSLSFSPSITSHFPPLFSCFSNSSILRRRQQHDGHGDELNSDPDAPPRLRPQIFLKAKLDEALNLANSLEQQRDGFYQTEFLEKEIPPHLVVQNNCKVSSCRVPGANLF